MRQLFIAAFLCVGCAGAWAAGEAPDALGRCLAEDPAHLSSPADGSEEEISYLLADVCPEEAERLRHHPWAELLPWAPVEATLFDLDGLSVLENAYTGRAPSTRLNPAQVGAALSRLERDAPDEQLSLWQRVIQWIRNWWNRQDEVDVDWLDNFSLSESFIKNVFYLSVALIVLMAIIIIVREVRAAASPRRLLKDVAWREAVEHRKESPISFDNLGDLPSREQPQRLLQIVLGQLQQSGLLPLRASRTHREISAATEGLPQGTHIGQLSAAAERSVFGGWSPTQQELESLVATGRAICRALEGQST